MLLQAFASGNASTILISLLACVFLVFVAVPVHEFAHVWAASKLGDDTGRMLGRYTLNPLAHLDPIGAILICLIGFGWGKPAPVNPNRFENPKKGMALTALAGPATNIIMTFLFLFVGETVFSVGPLAGTNIGAYIYIFCTICGRISIFLAVLNLIPVPPLDGYNILCGILPDNATAWIEQNQRIISFAFILFLITGVLTTPLSALANLVLNGISFICGLPFA